jgi:ABC-type sugar transport system permease subunit
VSFDMGYASALSWLFFIVMFAFTAVQFRTSRRWVYYAGERGR